MGDAVNAVVLGADVGNQALPGVLTQNAHAAVLFHQPGHVGVHPTQRIVDWPDVLVQPEVGLNERPEGFFGRAASELYPVGKLPDFDQVAFDYTVVPTVLPSPAEGLGAQPFEFQSERFASGQVQDISPDFDRLSMSSSEILGFPVPYVNQPGIAQRVSCPSESVSATTWSSILQLWDGAPRRRRSVPAPPGCAGPLPGVLSIAAFLCETPAGACGCGSGTPPGEPPSGSRIPPSRRRGY